METLAVPTTVAQAKAFVSPTSLSYPMQPEAMKDSEDAVAGDIKASLNTLDVKQQGVVVKTEGDSDDSSPGIVPTLQYALFSISCFAFL